MFPKLAITKEEFVQAQELTPEGRHGKSKKKQIYLPYRNRIFCSVYHDSRPMRVYLTGKKKTNGDRYMYFRCRNPKCPRKKHDIRGGIIIDEIGKLFPKIISNFSDEAYKTYLKETKELSQGAKRNARIENIKNNTRIESLRKKNEEITSQLAKITSNRMISEKNKQIASNYDEIGRLTAKIKENEQKLHNGQSSVRRYTEEEFKKCSKIYPNYSKKRLKFERA